MLFNVAAVAEDPSPIHTSRRLGLLLVRARRLQASAAAGLERGSDKDVAA